LVADAVVEPVTMVIEFGDTFITTSTMLGLRPNLRITNYAVECVHLVRIVLLFHLNSIFDKRVRAIDLLSLETIVNYQNTDQNVNYDY